MNLNPQQQVMANHHSGPMLGISVAGSGKTTTIVANIVNKFTEKGINPMRVLVTSFNKDAAEQLQARIRRSYPGLPRYAPIGTSHSLFLKMLRNEGMSYKGIVAEWTAKDIVLNTIGKKRYKNGEEANIIRAIGAMKNNCCYYKELQDNNAYERFLSIVDMAAEEAEVDVDDFIRAFAAYEVGMAQREEIDMDDMLFRCWVMFTRYPERLAKWQAQYDHIIVDEYQDTNEVQYQLFRMLAAQHQNFIAVGDDDQSIYGFRGAKPIYIRTFLEDYPHAQYVAMETNYRSQHGVLDTANRLIGNNIERYPKQLMGVHTLTHIPQVHELGDERHEAAWIADSIAASDKAKNQTAILTRINTQQAWIEEALVKKGIAYTLVGKAQSFFLRKEIVILTNYLRYAKNPTIELVKELANKPYRFIANDIINGWRDFQDFENDARFNNNVQKLWEQLEWIEMAYKKYDIIAILEFIVNKPCYMGIWATKQSSIQADVNPVSLMMQFAEMVKTMTVDSALALVDDVIAHLNRDDDDRDKVRISTIHSAKGLEWDAVYVPGWNEEMLPHKSNGDTEEERRLAYVAMTRAKKDLFLTLHRKDPPSLFLAEIMPTVEVISHETQEEAESPALTVTTDAGEAETPYGPSGGRDVAPVYYEPPVEHHYDVPDPVC